MSWLIHGTLASLACCRNLSLDLASGEGSPRQGSEYHLHRKRKAIFSEVFPNLFIISICFYSSSEASPRTESLTRKTKLLNSDTLRTAASSTLFHQYDRNTSLLTNLTQWIFTAIQTLAQLKHRHLHTSACKPAITNIAWKEEQEKCKLCKRTEN